MTRDRDPEATGPIYAIPPQPQPVLRVVASEKVFPVHRVFCIGRNYADHAIEMGHDPDREPPFFFLKPAGAVVTDGIFPYPPQTDQVHHEVEMVVALKSGGSDIGVETALRHVFGYGVGLDMTRRDLQDQAKKLSRPWDVAKGFDHCAPCGALMPADQAGHRDKGAITLAINGEMRQSGDLGQMIWTVPEIISTLSRSFTLVAGDIIMTGTPAGVGAVKRGDMITAAIEGLPELSVRVV